MTLRRNQATLPTVTAQPSPSDSTQPGGQDRPVAPVTQVVLETRPIAPTQLRDRGRYQVLGEHGRGGLGRIARAHDLELRRDVAIKELLSRDDVREARFVREAMITARLEHPGIVPVHEAGRWDDGTPFYAMKLVSGRPLRDLIAERATVEQRITLLHHVIAVADAIAYAHGRNIIHRDLKPANVIVGDFGETVVIDWGLAKDLNVSDDLPSSDGSGIKSEGRSSHQHDSELTAAGTVLGTPSYMAPEQERGEHVDQRADVFAIGAMLWELCSLQRVPPPHPRQRHRMLRSAGIDPDLITIIDKALARVPESRYRDAAALTADLKAFKAGTRIAARSYSLFALLAHWTRRHRALALSVSFVIVAATSASILYVRNISAARNRADLARAHAETAKDAVVAAQKSTEAAFHELALKNAELLLATDPSAAADILDKYKGPNKDLALVLRAKANGLGIAKLRASTHKDTVYLLQPLSNGRLLSLGEDGVAALTSIDGSIQIIATNGTSNDTSSFSSSQESLAYACQPEGLCLLYPTRGTSFSLRSPVLGLPTSIAFSPNGLRLAAQYKDEIVIWDTASSTPKILLRHLVSDVTKIIFASDEYIALASRTQIQVVRVDMSSTPTSTSFAMTAMAGLDDNIIAGNNDGDIWIIRAHDGFVAIRTHAICAGRVNAIIASRSRRGYAYACQDGQLGARTLDNIEIMHFRDDSAIFSLSVSQNEQYIAGGSRRGGLRIFDFSSGIWTTYSGQITRINTISGPTPTFPYFATGDSDGYIRVWNRPQASSRTAITARAPLYDVAQLADNTVVTIGGEPYLWWTRGTQQGRVPAHQGPAVAIRRSSDPEHFATFGYDGYIILWRLHPIGPVRRMNSGKLSDLEFANDGVSLISAGEDGRLLLWTAVDSSPYLLAQFSHPLVNVEVLRNSDVVVTTERGGSSWAVDIRDKKSVTNIRKGHGDTISRLVASDTGEWLGMGTTNGQVLLYDTLTWTPIPIMTAGGAIRSINFPQDMSSIAVVSEDGFAYLIPSPLKASSQPLAHWRTLALPARSSRYSPDGNALAITTSDGGIYFYRFTEMDWHYLSIPNVDVFGGRFSAASDTYASVDSGAHLTLFDISHVMQPVTSN